MNSLNRQICFKFRCGAEAWLTLQEQASPHICYHVKFGSSSSNSVCVNRTEPPKMGSAGVRPIMVWVWQTPTNMPLPMCYLLNLVILGQTVLVSVIKEIHLKIWPFASHLSRSLKVIRTDTDQSATYDFLLTFHGNHGTISYRFRDKRQFRSKSQIFPTPPCILCPAEGVPLGLGYRHLGSKN